MMTSDDGDVRPPGRTRIDRWLGALSYVLGVAVLAGTVLFLIDRGRAGVLPKVRVWLPLRPMLTLWAGHVLLALLATVAGAFARAVGRATTRVVPAPAWVGGVAVPAVVLVLLAASPLLWVGGELIAGAWISKQWFAPAVRLAPLSAWLCAAPVVAKLMAGRSPAGRFGPRARWFTLGLAVVGATVVDHVAARGLHPAFHLTANACAGIALVLLACEVWEAQMSRASSRARLIVGGTTAVGVATSMLLWGTMSQATRSALVLHSPVLQHWLREVLPTPPSTLLSDVLAELDVSAGSMDAGGAERERGLIAGGERWNVMVVVVDTLRADALPPWRPAEGTPFAQPGDTPALDAWLEGTQRFTRAHASATMTHKSMPSMLRSIEVGEDPVATGLPIARRMESLGRTPVAVINEYFYGSKHKSVYPLLEGFEDLRVYEKRDGDQTVPFALELLDQVGSQPFFMWVHFYGMHDPGFDGRLLRSSDGSRVERYRKSLRWLDAQFATLLAGIAERGLTERTLIVLVSDHGEGLGDHEQVLHGPNVYEEDIRVPLAFGIPGRPGAIVDATVGNIDVVPTIIDLLGAPIGDDRGRSLVPLMVGQPDPMTPPYYFENSNGKRFGVLLGTDKLVYDQAAGSVHRYDLAEDVEEAVDRFDPGGELDHTLIRELIRFNPRVVGDELQSEAIVELLRQRLQEVDPRAPGAAVPMLVRLVGAIPKRPLVKRALEIFRESDDFRLRLLLVATLWKHAPKSFPKLLGEWLVELEGKPGEGELVAALALRGQPAFASKAVAERMTKLAAEADFVAWEPWLQLIQPWPKKVDLFGPPLGQMLDRVTKAGDGVPPVVIEALLDDIAGFAKDGSAFVADVRGLLDHPQAGVRAAAVRCLGRLSDREARSLVLARLRDSAEDPRVRREATAALAAIAGSDAVEPLVAIGRERLMTNVVIRELAKIGDKAAVPWLNEVAEKDYNLFTRRAAKSALDKLGAPYAKPGDELQDEDSRDADE